MACHIFLGIPTRISVALQRVQKAERIINPLYESVFSLDVKCQNQKATDFNRTFYASGITNHARYNRQKNNFIGIITVKQLTKQTSC